MKSYEDIAERVFQKGDEILKRKQKRIALIKKNTLIISEICAAIIVCFGVWKTNDMEILPHRNFPDNVINESENNTEISVPVSTSENKENEIYISQTTAADETDIEREINTSVFATGSAAEITLQDTDIPNNRSTAQTQMPVQTVVQTNLQTTAQNDLQTNLITTKIQPQVTVCTTEQIYDERSYYMKKLASLSVSAILIASSVTPSIGSAKYEIDTSRYWPGEKAIFAKMDSGELDIDINGDGVFDLLDGYTMQLYFDHKVEPDYVFSNPKMEELYYSTLYQVVDQETINRIEAIADYNEDGKVTDTDKAHLVRYFIANQKLKIEHLDPAYYSTQSLCESHHETHGNWTSEECYVNLLCQHMEYLHAGYDIVAEMYENGMIDLDFNGNGQLDIGDIYDFYVYYNENTWFDTNDCTDYLTAEEVERCREAYQYYPSSSQDLIGSPQKYNFLYYVTLYVVGHIELKSEYFTEEYYQETFSPYYRPSEGIINYRVEAAANYLGLKPDEDDLQGSAKYEIDTSRYWPGEKEIFAKMDSGELDVDINGNGEFDVFDGFLLKCYVDGLSVPDNTAGFKLDSETVNRIKAIADYNNDEIVDQSDVKSLMRYFIASRKMKSEYLDPTYYNPEYTDFDYKYNNVPKPAEVRYAFSLHKNVEALLAGYDIVAEMYEDGSLNLDFNGNGHLDVGDVYDLYIYESLNRENVDTEEIKSDYISDEEWDRCDEAFATYPHVVGGLSSGSSYNFLYYVTLYVAGHTELRPEYFTEKYYQETYSNYYQAPQYWISSRMRDAAKILGLKIDDKVWIKYDEDEFYDFFDAYCNDVENDLRPAPDVNMDGVVDYYDYFAANIYFEDLLNDVTADESILSADIWNNLAENCDFNGNGTSKDICDILTVQIYVIKYCGSNDAFELAYKDYTEKLGGTSTHTTEAVSYENNLRILSELEKNTVVYGDANCDGKVTIADSTAIMQSLGNPDKYKLSEQGARNADCCNPGDGVTTSDAIAIQKIHSKILSKLPEISK